MRKIRIKTQDQIKIMHEGGQKLGHIRDELITAVEAGVNAMEIEKLANNLIERCGGKASFKMVPGYSWATCINVNNGVVHGIPKESTVFNSGDVVSVDVGLFYKGFHTDTSASKVVGEDKNKQQFLRVGRQALDMAIAQAQPGNHIYDISKAFQDIIEDAGYNVVRALTGHGVGVDLHEAPFVPCFVEKGANARLKSPEIVPGMVLALEIMYTQGSGEVDTAEDGWTIVTVDGKISALFEETVAVQKDGPIVLTNA